MGSEFGARKTTRALNSGRKNTHKNSRAARRGVTALIAGALVAAGGIVAAPTLTAAPAQAATTVPTVALKWSHGLGHPGAPVAKSSPMVATLNGGGSDIVVGDRAGYERAFSISGAGAYVKGWPVSTGGVAVDSTASVRGSGSGARVYFGEGTSSAPSRGGYRALASTGKTAWHVTPQAQPGKGTAGVMSGLAIGNSQSNDEVVGGSMGQMQDMIDASTGKIATGFPWFQADSNFTTPAVSNLGLGGRDMVIEGGDSTAGVALGKTYKNGGHIRILGALGNHGTGNLGGGLRCSYDTNQVVQGSPAVGPFLSGGAYGIVAGTGSYYGGASDTNKVIAMDTSCHAKWIDDLHGITDQGPALADVMGTGHNWVIQPSRGSNNTSRVYALDGSNGKALWWTSVPGQAFGQVAAADLTGLGYMDVVIATTSGAYIIDGRSGKVVEHFASGIGFQNTPLITNDPNGTIGITLAGYDNHNTGIVQHYTVTSLGTSAGAKVNVKGAWPMFHHDQKLTGDSNTVLAAKP